MRFENGSRALYRELPHTVVEVIEEHPPILGHVKDRGWYARPEPAKALLPKGPFYRLRCAHKPACRDIEYEKQNLLPGERNEPARWGPPTTLWTWIHEELLKTGL